MAQHFDVSLKLLFRQFYGIVARSIFGEPEVEWINVELPAIRNPRVDMVARDRNNCIISNWNRRTTRTCRYESRSII